MTNFTHEQHLAFAPKMRKLHAELLAWHAEVCSAFGKTHRASDKLRRMSLLLVDIRNELDNEYHAVTTHEQFVKHGHVYYGAEHVD